MNIYYPTDPCTLAGELARKLRELNAVPDAPHVFERPLSFYDGMQRKNWLGSLPDIDDGATVAEFCTTAHHGKKTWLALITCPSAN
ncbi:hypothetical protein MY3296_010159 [Beauveria thailandica]